MSNSEYDSHNHYLTYDAYVPDWEPSSDEDYDSDDWEDYDWDEDFEDHDDFVNVEDN